MIPEFGHFALIVCLLLSFIQVAIPIAGAQTGNVAWMRIARPTARVQFALVLFAFGCLIYSFLTNDFSVRYVAMTSSRLLPIQYKVAAVWGGHEGSILLWLLMLTFLVVILHFMTHRFCLVCVFCLTVIQLLATSGIMVHV
jgi:cytochrome c-type biogenesis protein CcmF